MFISTLNFFEPDQKMLQWLKDYANGRLIIDVGCGTGHVIRELHKIKTKVIGIDPCMDVEKFHRENLQQGIGLINVIYGKAQQCDLTKLPHCVLLFCRPCHSNFVEETIKVMHPASEALYITVPKNWDDYNDLGRFKEKAEIVEHEGSSLENEKVWKIKKM